MHLVEESAIVRGMIRVESGDDVIQSLEAIAFAAGWTEVFVTGAGILDLVEIGNGITTTALEKAEIVSLSGRVARGAGRAEARLMVQVFANGQVHSGRIHAALGGDALLVVDAALAGAKRANIGAPPTRMVAAAPAPPPEPAPAPRGSAPGLLSGIGAKLPLVPIARGELALGDDDEEFWSEVAAGDLLEHPQLGSCDVLGEDESGGMRVRIGSGRVCVLRLDTLEIKQPTEDEAGRKIYRVVGPKRRR